MNLANLLLRAARSFGGRPAVFEGERRVHDMMSLTLLLGCPVPQDRWTPAGLVIGSPQALPTLRPIRKEMQWPRFPRFRPEYMP